MHREMFEGRQCVPLIKLRSRSPEFVAQIIYSDVMRVAKARRRPHQIVEMRSYGTPRIAVSEQMKARVDVCHSASSTISSKRRGMICSGLPK